MATTDVVTGGAVVVGIVAILFALRPYLLKAKGDGHSAETRAGFRDSAVWDQRFDKLESAIATVDRIIRDNRQTNLGEMSDLRDLLVEIDTSLKVAAAKTLK